VQTLDIAVNVSQVPKRSPFRYPGGKTWLIPVLRRWLEAKTRHPSVFVEPFAGGATASLLAVNEGYCKAAYFAELDPEVASVWNCTLSDKGPELASLVERFAMNQRRVRELFCRCRTDQSLLTRALAVLVHNRIQRGGILAPGAGRLKAGEDGRGLTSRWYPKTLANRLMAIHNSRSSYHFIEGDGFALLNRHSNASAVLAFVDPPYFLAAHRLYSCWKIDHQALFSLLSKFQGDFLLAYDDAPQIRAWAREFGFKMVLVKMKTTNHQIKSELLLSRNLNWITQAVAKSGHFIAASVHTRTLSKRGSGRRPTA
jgi:DNA adenine methylase